MTEKFPISGIQGIELHPTDIPGVDRVVIINADAKSSLSWDRYVRLSQAAKYTRQLLEADATILDVGGFDGALGCFLPDKKICLIDPITTGGSFLQNTIADKSFDAVVAVDVLEHVEPSQRREFLRECGRISKQAVILNYPCEQSIEAQRLVYAATKNALVKEHIEWPLPNSTDVQSHLRELGFETELIEHSSVAVWAGQYLTQNLNPLVAATLNRYLIDNHSEETFGTPLYHLVVAVLP